MHQAFRKAELQNRSYPLEQFDSYFNISKNRSPFEGSYPSAAKSRGSQCLSINTITNDGCRWRSNPVSNLIELRLILHPTRGCPRRAIRPFADGPVRRGCGTLKSHESICSCSVAVTGVIDGFQLSLCTSGQISSVLE